MLLLQATLLVFFSNLASATWIEVDLKLNCTLPINNFNGSVVVHEHDETTANDIISSLFPISSGRFQRMYIKSWDENDGGLPFIWDYTLEPFLNIYHNCHADERYKDRYINTHVTLPDCSPPSCFYEVDVTLLAGENRYSAKQI